MCRRMGFPISIHSTVRCSVPRARPRRGIARPARVRTVDHMHIAHTRDGSRVYAGANLPAGRYVCPLCTQPLSLRSSGSRTAHFAHLPGADRCELSSRYDADYADFERRLARRLSTFGWELSFDQVGTIPSRPYQVMDRSAGTSRTEVAPPRRFTYIRVDGAGTSPVAAVPVADDSVALADWARMTEALNEEGLAVWWVFSASVFSRAEGATRYRLPVAAVAAQASSYGMLAALDSRGRLLVGRVAPKDDSPKGASAALRRIDWFGPLNATTLAGGRLWLACRTSIHVSNGREVSRSIAHLEATEKSLRRRADAGQLPLLTNLT